MTTQDVIEKHIDRMVTKLVRQREMLDLDYVAKSLTFDERIERLQGIRRRLGKGVTVADLEVLFLEGLHVTVAQEVQESKAQEARAELARGGKA